MLMMPGHDHAAVLPQPHPETAIAPDVTTMPRRFNYPVFPTQYFQLEYL